MFPRRWRIEVSDSFSFSFLITAVISEYIFELFVVMPVTEEGYVPHFIHVILGTFIFINILSNLAMTMRKDSSTRGIILPSLLKPEWHFCAACEANSPPRAFHCAKCKICVLKRDHHCTFACCCIGLKNFRYFLFFLLYLSIGATYASMFNLYFIWDVLGGFSLFSLAVHIIPFVFFLLGYLSFRAFICTFMSVLSICGVLFVSNLFVLHLRQMLQGQTTFEKNHAFRAYDLGWKRNLTQSLGINWHLVWLFPLINSPLPSDGLSFKVNEAAEPMMDSILTGGNIRQRHGIFIQ